MKLLNHHLGNFKGIKDFALDTQGRNVNIYGENATGKTSILDGFLWLLFGKDSQNKADFAIKTLDADGNEIHGLEHAVESVLGLNEKKLTLRKVYSEKWTKKRGAAKKEFTGHTTDHFIDGVPVKKGEYDARIANIANEDIFKLLTSPTYFNEHLHWQDRRERLLLVCGDISDEEVIASDKSLSSLPKILNGRKLEDHRKVIQARRSEINKELEKIPVRIDEADMAKPDISTIKNPDVLPDEMKAVKESIKKENEKLARLESGGEVAEKTKRLREIEAEIIQLQSNARSKNEDEIRKLQDQASQIRGRILTLQVNVTNHKSSSDRKRKGLVSLNEQMEKLRGKWHELAGEEFQKPEQSDVCPTCGQTIPEEQVRSAIEKAQAEYNCQKAEKLELINAEGKRLKAQADEFQAEIEKTEQAVADSEEKLKQENTTMEIFENKIEALRRDAENQKEDPAVGLKLREKTVAEKEIEALRAGNTEARGKLIDGIVALEKILSALEESQAKVKMRKSLDDRIEELKVQERELAAEFERLEGELYLTEEFIRQKVSLLEEKFNSKFEMARFRLFSVLVNGAVEECCETTYQGVPFSSLNNGAKINVGLDIIRTLAKHYNFYPPIFIDNREAVTSLIDMGDQQVISLIVSEDDKELRVEVGDEKKKGVA